jgi:excisionase family DNA binding protein
MPGLTTTEAATALGITPRRVVALIHSGRLRATKRGRDWSITPKALEAVRERKAGRPARNWSCSAGKGEGNE